MRTLHDSPPVKVSPLLAGKHAGKTLRRLFSFIILLLIVFCCQQKAKDIPAQAPVSPKAPPVQQPAQISVTPPEKPALASGRYKGGLIVAVNGNAISGYYQDASGWDSKVEAPRFSCEYSFHAQYAGSDSIPLTLSFYETATGVLKILTPEKIAVTLSLNPCKNEEATTETWEIEKAYPLIAVKQIAAEKSYFYSAPDTNTQRKAYLVKGDPVEVTDTTKDWYQVTYRGAQSTTKGWIRAAAFETNPYAGLLPGTWLSKAGEPYEVYYRFYTDNRYKTWSFNSFEPQGMTGSFRVNGREVTLYPCGLPAKKMGVKDFSAREIALMIPGTGRWTAFEKEPEHHTLEKTGFLIKNRQIITTVNNRVVRIPSSGTRESFLDIVCPFEVTEDTISRGEGTFHVLRVSTKENGALFYAIIDSDSVVSLVVDQPLVRTSTIKVGDTFAQLKKSFPSVTLIRSEIEGEIVGTTPDFSFTFGYLDPQVFNRETNAIPDTTRIRQLIL